MPRALPHEHEAASRVIPVKRHREGEAEQQTEQTEHRALDGTVCPFALRFLSRATANQAVADFRKCQHQSDGDRNTATSLLRSGHNLVYHA